MFKAMDTDNSGAITFDELKAGLRSYGSTLKDTEIRDLMDAVRCLSKQISAYLVVSVFSCTSLFHCHISFSSFSYSLFFPRFIHMLFSFIMLNLIIIL